MQKIKAELPVYAEVVPLAKASQISSLRKVFGERYPDPVRVISVGMNVDALIADPSNSEWQSLSVEFCGGTHLTNTKAAEDFVIVEESGIAKGIRRISALTRTGALIARQKAAELGGKVHYMENMAAGPELDAMFKTVKIEVDQAIISLVDKDNLRNRLNGVYETIKQFYKANIAARVAEASEKAASIAQSAKDTNLAVAVINIDFGGDAKVAKKIQERIRSIYTDGSFFLLSPDADGEKVTLFPIVSAAHVAKGLSAKEWVDHCISVCGAGKGGGRADNANGSIPGGADVLNKVIEAASSFASGKV